MFYAKRSLLFIATLLAIILLQIAPVTAKKTSLPANPNLLEIAKQKYDRGQLNASAETLKKAVIVSRDDGQTAEEAKALSLLSLVYEKMGYWQDAARAIANSLSLSENLIQANAANPEIVSLRAQVLNRRGRWELATGNAEAALNTARQAELLYSQLDDFTGSTGSRINQAQALKTLGFYQQAKKIQQTLSQQIEFLPDTEIKITALHSLGNLWQQSGEFNLAKSNLTQALSLARKQRQAEFESKILLGLGNIERSLVKIDQQASEEHLQQILNYYRDAAQIATTPMLAIQAQLNEVSYLISLGRTASAKDLLQPIAKKLDSLSGGRSAVFARINFAQSILSLQKHLSPPKVERYLITNLRQAIAQAQNLQDSLAESYARGTLGKYYEQKQEWQQARQLTESALSIAQQLNLPELSYQWQWQMGRICRAQNNNATVAIAYYDLAIDSLKNLRQDLVVLNSELQFSFEESIEPVYRQYIDLLLASPQANQNNLIKSIKTLEELQIAELDNLFRDACARAKVSDVSDLDKNVAIVYPIVLPERLELILKLPGDSQLYRHTQIDLTESKINAAVTQLQQSLVRRSTSPDRIKQQSTQFYDWLIRPFASQLEAELPREESQIKTLVFVLDDALRNLPISVLYDGRQYAVERYGLAISPGTQLIENQELSREKLRVLLAGASNAPSFQALGLAPLSNVSQELAGIADAIKQTEKLEDREFQQMKLQEKINQVSFNIVHIATHGQFGSSSQQTYILDWNESIGLNDLDRLLEAEDPTKAKTIDLLVLSACETATSDKRAALGLAGVAVRSGASTTVASLWQINDASTAQFMVEFYQHLNNPQLTTVEALRNTQLSFIARKDDSDYNRPYHWGAFVLVGDWR